MLALKLLLVPAFLGLLTLAGRWLGPAVSGWLAGLPLVAGPIVLVLALEHGPVFAAAAAQATLAAVAAATACGVAYARTARRRGWPTALAAGWAAWLLTALALHHLGPGLWASLALALAALGLAPRLFPGSAAAGPHRPGGRDLLLRMAAGALLTLAVAETASTVGGRWSGTLALFPVLGSVLAVFSHRRAGADHAGLLLRGMARGMFSLAAFFAVAAWLLPHRTLAEAFGAATLACLTVQLATMRWHGGPGRPGAR